ncbi:FtsK/SpoIIIE domain-containing protein [Streptomyces radicis]|uniref:Cell division protein FtsK n=1 Tax=Streptomyces radicis TaxID=1750517 RepID=A0A3A9WIU9_9ACTN|nr:FtsK/SpoIIIE domain-containing protein [Streptomyces radicis]RKN12948.1 cell division protein FtsK [Streptomyces radicis]RKN27838.1 cell division protein FtsK [Streptomyces radicis]
MAEVLSWSLAVVLAVAVVARGWWQPRLSAWWAVAGGRPWPWLLLGYPAVVLRMRWSWRRLCTTTGLAVMKSPRWLMVGRDTWVAGRSLRPSPPGLGVARPTRAGLRVRVRLHPGQVPEQVEAVADALAHAWRVHAVRVSSPRRGVVLLVVTARDPLTAAGGVRPGEGSGVARRLLSAVVGRLEDGAPWVVDLRRVPHWLVVGATQSGKSTWLASLVTELAPQPVALVGIDCKGGLELGLFERRLSVLATSRAEAAEVLRALVEEELPWRMTVCRSAGVRDIWHLPKDERPFPIVVIVDELAELYLSDGSREGRREAADCSVALLRLAQLGRALGAYLVVAGQRVGSELGPGVTALRAQLGGRVVHRVNDEATAEMALGDLQPGAVAVAQTIGEDEPGVAVTAVSGRWSRARSALVSPEEAERAAVRYGHRTPVLARLAPPGGEEAAP